MLRGGHDLERIGILCVAVCANSGRRLAHCALEFNVPFTSMELMISCAARELEDGKTVAECMELGKTIVVAADCMPGVRERITLLQIEATFPDGTKLVSCHDPIGA